MTEPFLHPDFQHIRELLQVPAEFSAEALAEAERAAQRKPQAGALPDLQAVPFITIDPPSSQDLDQAFFAERQHDGYGVRYAIADVGFFVPRGSAIEQAAWQRGLTFYSPDVKAPLYPPILSENAASLLPEVLRPAIVFSFRLDAQAEIASCTVERAIIRSRAKLAYAQVSAHLNSERTAPGSGALAGEEWVESLLLLEEIGRKREQFEAERGGISLRIPTQEVEQWATALHGYRLAFEESSAVEGWNAQISLMTGMAAAQMMIKHKTGLLRALDPPRPDRVAMLRLTAQALDVHWPPELDYDDFVRGLDPRQPLHLVMLHQATRVTGGARYVAFADELPGNAYHSAIAAPYAHVTAPLRRLADRYVLDLLLELTNGNQPPPELIEPLQRLPQVMSEAERLARQLEIMIVDFAEARLMQSRVGETFQAMVIGLRREGIIVQITDPPIRTLLPLDSLASATADLSPSLSDDRATLEVAGKPVKLGARLWLKLEAAHPATRSLDFSLV